MVVCSNRHPAAREQRGNFFCFQDFAHVPLFFFQIIHDTEEFPPEELDLPDPEAAWRQATSAAGEMLRDLGGQLRPGTEWRMTVSDGARKPIFGVRVIAEAYD